MVEAINLIGSTQVQGRASAGGNLCNASPAADQRAGAGRGRRHRDHPGAPRASAPGAGREVRSRTRQDHAEAGRDRRQPDPARAAEGRVDAYLRLIPRTEMDIAVVGVGVSLTMKGDTVHCRPRRPGRGGADRAAGRKPPAKALIGSKLDDAALDAAADACSAACRPIDDKRGTIKYRTKIAGVLLDAPRPDRARPRQRHRTPKHTEPRRT